MQLREAEARCIQEEQPFCTAACPIHVDVRAFMAALTKGNIREARRILDRTMPFPEIVGRLCDQPCYSFCKRGEIGDPLATARLERYVVSNSETILKLPKLPPKNGRVAIIGAGLSGMTAALDVSRKGRSTTLFTKNDGLGGTLHQFEATILPPQTLLDAEKILAGYDVTLHPGTALNEQSIAALIAEYDAIYFDLDEIPRDLLPANTGAPDPLSLTINHDRCFAGGGLSSDTAAFSVMKQVEDGRRAALSIERFLQKVSLTAQRGMEGARSTRMYTVTEHFPAAAEVVPVDPTAGYSSEEAAQEAARCIHCQCLECVKQCVYLREYKEYPKTLVRKIYNNQSIVQGTRAANKMINSCSLCGQCTTICPHDFPVAEICRTTRQELIENNHMPPSAHEFALDDMHFSLSELCTLNRHQPGTTSSRYVFYPGCQLAGSAPELVKKVYQFLGDQMVDGVALMLGCCGIPAHWSGRKELFTETINGFKAELEKLGNPTVITACSSCQSVFDEFADTIKIVPLWEVLDTLQLPVATNHDPTQPLTLHDPCTTRHQPDVRSHVRSLCTKLGLQIIDHEYHGELADCCGYGGLMQFANPPLGGKAAHVKAERSELPGLAYCAMCRDNLAAAGAPVAHLLDYIFVETEAEDPLNRKNPGFSARHENRARLKEQLLAELWGEATSSVRAHQKIRLVLSQEIIDLLNNRHILEEDIKKVILCAEQTGKHMINPDNNHRLVGFKPIRVTYWVEYEATDQGYVIHNAYSHRMQLPEAIG